MKKSATDKKVEKFRTLQQLLNEEYFILVHLDPSTDDVSLPDHLIQDDSVTLKLSQHFKGRMHLTQNKIIAELLFQGSYFDCHVPLDAIWGCSTETEKNHVWTDSMPESVVTQLVEENLEIVQAQHTPEQKAEPDGETSETNSTSNSDDKFKQRGHLRRVK